jgi:hypothetical protein
MGKLASLLRWHKTIVVKDDNGVPLRDEKGKPINVTIRIVGDKDLEDASKIARLASAYHRLSLMNPDSDEYKDEILVFDGADKSSCIQMIMAGEGANWANEALSNIEKENDISLDEVAVDPDAPTLDELEQFDKKIEDQQADYLKRLEKYVKEKQEALFGEINQKELPELIEQAKASVMIVRSIEVYLNRLLDEKVWRSVYSDKEMTVREFNSLDEFNNLNSVIKNRLREAYQEIEKGLDDVKN